ncbi:Outer membrane lipoprotein-sorting protein [Chitinispirillum alkaliphilum]|nr:Outer membrane lipoprotein-sorting protein [Chitinispirillum alkaliphilum]
MQNCKLYLILIVLAVFLNPASAMDAQEVIRRADQQIRGETSRTELTMRIERPRWTREMSLRAYTKGRDFSLIYVLSPARDRGTSFLKRRDEVWQWVPDIQRVVRIPPSMMNQSWMGSDFTNDDLVRDASVVDDYTHSFLPDTVVDGEEAWRIEMVPKPQAPVVWERVVVWVIKENFIQRRSEFYDEDGVLVNLLYLEDVREMGGRLIPTRWEMVPLEEEGHRTVMVYDDVEFDIPLDQGFFSQQNMRQIR